MKSNRKVDEFAYIGIAKLNELILLSRNYYFNDIIMTEAKKNVLTILGLIKTLCAGAKRESSDEEIIKDIEQVEQLILKIVERVRLDKNE